MKKLLLLFVAMVLMTTNSFSQEKTYLIFELMKVDNEQEADYWKVEEFWEKIHKQRIINGELLGWDMWSLKPGGEDEGYQYMTVSVYDNPIKMFKGDDNFPAAVKAAYPEMSDDEFQSQMKKTSKSRDLSKRFYLEVIKETEGEYDMDIGSIAFVDFMKATNSTYETAEIETFLPMHQKAVDMEAKEKWSLLRIMSPSGSDAYATHITVNMFLGFEQVFSPKNMDSNEKLSEEVIKKIEEGIKSRDLKWTNIATLLRKVR